jgi:HD-GYP domain-containing protein (c-di-GMP phosphodiesterase class II)
MRETEAGRPTTWTARPWVARLIRAFVYLMPVLVSVISAWVLSGVVPRPSTFAAGVARWFLIAAGSTVLLVLVDKLARRLLPLATLFGLTLAFPDQAPSRFRLALRSGSTAQLRKRIAQANAGAPTDTPAAAAERVLELVIALNAHDRLTRGHSERVRAYTQMIGEEMGLTEVELDRLRWSGLLHDIGKLRISSDILNKPGKLTDAEFDEIKLHPEYGRELVAPLIAWLGDSARAVWEHHERWDGRGYPHGLAGTDISLAGRIVSVADTYDVITSVRSYKKAISPVEARAELTRCAGSQFDPAVVRAFMNLSLGRLRLAMGPLSWLAQVPLFPQALASTAATGTAGAATAATALVGAAAASMGLGLAGDHVVPKDRVAFAQEAEATQPFDDVEFDTGRRTAGAPEAVTGTTQPGGDADPGGMPSGDGGVAGGGVGPDGEVGPAPAVPDDPDGGATPTTTRPQSPTATTIATGGATTVPSGVTTTVPRGTPTTTRPPAGATTTTPLVTLPGVTVPTIPVPTVAVPTLPVTIPPVITNPSTTTAPPTVPPTTTTVAATTTTVPQRPAWLPPANVATTLYFDVPGAVDVAARPVLPLVRTAPTALAVADADGDGQAGITIARTPPGQPTPGTGELAFGLHAPTEARIQGAASGVIYASTPALLASTVTVRARLMSCDAGGSCHVLSERTGSALVTILALLPIGFDFGTIDVTVPAGGTLRVVLDVPSSSSGDLLLSSDAALNPASITVVFR